MAKSDDYESQEEGIRLLCQEAALLRGWTPEETWEKAKEVAKLLNLSAFDSLDFIQLSAKTAIRMKQIPDPDQKK